MLRYLTTSELIFINGRILRDRAIQTGAQKIRDLDLLLAAEQRPQASVFGADAYPTLPEKAGALLHSIARNHPFRDGNKRTAVVSALFFLEVNGHRAQWTPTEALEVILNMAEGRAQVEDFAVWLQTRPVPPRPEPDESADTAHIDALLHEHQWLLDELAQR
jgi:death-on-curing protein